MKWTRYNPINGQVILLRNKRASRTNHQKRECQEFNCTTILFSKRNKEIGFCAKCQRRRKIK